MLKLVRGTLRWGREDVVAMARVLGAEHAAKRRAPWQPSIAKLARKRGVVLSPKVERQLRKAEDVVRMARKLRRMEDAFINSPRHDEFFPHQRADLCIMQELGLPAYLLAHEPGVGKTLVAIWWASAQCQGERILVITPNTAKEQWAREIRRWDPHSMPVTIVEGTSAQQIEKAMTKRGWIIGHWESLVHARIGYRSRPYDVAILDEAQFIQNRQAQRSQTAHAIDARYRLALSGHPFANSPDEYFSILKFLYPEQYSSFWRFVGMHITLEPKPFGGFSVLGASKPKLLKWETTPFVIRRTKREVFKSLPPITRVQRIGQLTPKGRREYDRLRKEFFAELEGIDGEEKLLAIPSILARITRLRQYLIDPALLGAREPSVKFPMVLELMREVERPIVLFSMFREALVNLGVYLKRHKMRVGMIAGASSKRDKAKRTAVQRDFLAGNLDALLVVTQAGGTALNLGKYGYVAHLDLPWNPKDLEQTEGRVDRPEEGTGKLVPTTSYRLIIQDSYEEKLERRLERKYSQFKEVFTVNDARELFE